MKHSFEYFWLRCLELSPAALGFLCFILLPLVQKEANTNIATYKPVKDESRPSRPRHLRRIAELIPSIDIPQPMPTFS